MPRTVNLAPGSAASSRPETMTPTEAQRIVDKAAELYFEEQRRRVDGFVDRHFSIAGSLALHRNALGADMLRAPLNIALAIPYFALQVGAAAARACRAERIARHLRSRRIFLKTAVGREIEWLLVTDLLELPFRQGKRVSTRDAIAEAILVQEPVDKAVRTALEVVRPYAAHPDFRRQLEESVMKYTDSRAAGAEIATTLIALGTERRRCNRSLLAPWCSDRHSRPRLPSRQRSPHSRLGRHSGPFGTAPFRWQHRLGSLRG